MGNAASADAVSRPRGSAYEELVEGSGDGAFDVVVDDRADERAVPPGPVQRRDDDLEQIRRFAAHDLRAPLRRVAVMVDILTDDSAPPTGGAGAIDRGTLRRVLDDMRAQIDALEKFAALGGDLGAPVDVDLDDLVGRVAAAADRRSGAPEVAIGPLPTVVGHPELLAELFGHLLDNAFRHGAHDGLEVTVRSEPAAEAVVVSITDNGPGVAAAFHEEAFQLGRRLQSTAASDEGRGVGLTYARRIARIHGGDVVIDVAHTQGCRLLVTLAPRPPLVAGETSR